MNVEFGKTVAEKYGCKFYASGEEMIASDDIDYDSDYKIWRSH
ncbi:MAG: hypothetical protein ACI4GE_05645 [Lachnospiraceae bacterium]|nr:hypothetical protein [Lachnospiraceae bacterium]